MTIIGIGTKQRAGKDTAAQALVRDLGYKHIAFAGPLKALALEANPIVLSTAATVNVSLDHNRLRNVVVRDGWEAAKDRYPAVRRFLQDLGVGAREVFGDDFWVKQALANVKGDTVISDMRFVNEAEAIREAGGVLVRIDRSGTPGDHISEKDLDAWDDWDLVIDNSASVVELESAIVQFAQGLRRKESSALPS